jgi:hypothetical protein
MRGTVGVHVAHCCKWHGCKYGDLDCPVTNGEVEQKYQCEDCWHILKDEGYYRRMVQDIDEIKAWWAEKKK